MVFLIYSTIVSLILQNHTMKGINVDGNGNILNNGVVEGNFIVGDLIFNFFKTHTMNIEDREQTLLNMTETQKKLADAIDKFAQAELIRAESGKIRDEADKLRAEADKNNSLANLNYSKVMMEDRILMKAIVEKSN